MIFHSADGRILIFPKVLFFTSGCAHALLACGGLIFLAFSFEIADISGGKVTYDCNPRRHSFLSPLQPLLTAMLWKSTLPARRRCGIKKPALPGPINFLRPVALPIAALAILPTQWPGRSLYYPTSVGSIHGYVSTVRWKRSHAFSS